MVAKGPSRESLSSAHTSKTWFLQSIPVNLAQHLLVGAPPGRLLQFIYLNNFQVTTASPILKIRQLIIRMLARITYPKPHAGFSGHCWSQLLWNDLAYSVPSCG